MCNVTASVERIYFETAAAHSVTSADDDTQRLMFDGSVTTLSWTEGVTASLSCVSVGGYPPPTVTIQLDSVDMTDQFALSYSATLRGTRGLRVIDYISERSAAKCLAKLTKCRQKHTSQGPGAMPEELRNKFGFPFTDVHRT